MAQAAPQDPDPTVRRPSSSKHGTKGILLGRYTVIGALGRGAMGEVLEVRDGETGSAYALKHVPPELARDTTQMDAIRANFALVSQLSHPHIATMRFLESDRATREVFILMDLVRGKNLAEWTSAERERQRDPDAVLPMGLSLGICEQIASALDYAHSQPVSVDAEGRPSRYGILHRDLKPANVMLETAREYRPGVPYVKLVDFGLAAEVQASMQSRSLVGHWNQSAGTPAYMAPEVWEGRTLTRGVDQWSLAVLLYEMVAGRRPFNAPTETALRYLICKTEPERPEGLADAQWAAIRKALSVDRKKRYQSCMALVKALAEADPATKANVLAAEMPMPEEFPGKVASGTRVAAPARPSGRGRDLAPRPSVRQNGRMFPIWVGAGVGMALIALWLLLADSGGSVPKAAAARAEKATDKAPKKVLPSGQEPDVGPKADVKTVNPVSPASQQKPDVSAPIPRDAQKGANILEDLHAALRAANPQYKGNGRFRTAGNKIVEVDISQCEIGDLSPLAGMKLAVLNCGGNRVSDLSPLRGMNLKVLHCWRNEVANLADLEGMPLEELYCDNNRIANLSPLKGMSLRVLVCWANRIADLSPLKGMPIEELWCGMNQVTDLSPLRGMRLRVLACWDNRITDLSPLDGMPIGDLRLGKNRVSSLEPLRGMPLTHLELFENLVADLSPLTGMKLRLLNCSGNRVRSLSPLRNAPLRELWCENNEIGDLSPLKGMPLEVLQCSSNQVSDLSPLRGMALTRLGCGMNRISDLLPLAGMPLEDLRIHRNRISGLEALRGMPLTGLECCDCEIADLSPLSGMKLKVLLCHQNRISDLSPLKGMPLEELWCGDNPISSLAPLEGTKLRALYLWRSRVTDLSPLRELPLESLSFLPGDVKTGLNAVRGIGAGKLIGATFDQLLPADEFWRKYDRGDFNAALESPGARCFDGWHPHWARAVFTPDSRQVVSAGGDGLVRLWDVASGRLIRVIKGHYGAPEVVACLPDGKRILTGANDRTARLWDVATGEMLLRWVVDHQRVMRVAISPDGRRALIGPGNFDGGGDGSVRLWDLDEGGEIARFEGHQYWVAAAFVPDGKRFVSWGGDTTLRLWDIERHAEVRRYSVTGGWINRVVISPDGRFLLQAGGHVKAMRLLDLESGQEMHRHDQDADTHDICFSPDGSHVLQALANGKVLLWRVNDWTQVKVFEASERGAASVAFSHDGRLAVAGCFDGKIRLWPMPESTWIRATPPKEDTKKDTAKQ